MNTNISQNRELLPQSIIPFINSNKINDVTLHKEVNSVLKKLYKIIPINPELIINYIAKIQVCYNNYMDIRSIDLKDCLFNYMRLAYKNIVNKYEQIHGVI